MVVGGQSRAPAALNAGKETRYGLYGVLWAPGDVWVCVKNLAPTGLVPRTVHLVATTLYRQI